MYHLGPLGLNYRPNIIQKWVCKCGKEYATETRRCPVCKRKTRKYEFTTGDINRSKRR
jgi:hypothetical protein